MLSTRSVAMLAVAGSVCAGGLLGWGTVAGIDPLPKEVRYTRAPPIETVAVEPVVYPADTWAEYAPPIQPVAYRPEPSRRNEADEPRVHRTDAADQLEFDKLPEEPVETTSL